MAPATNPSVLIVAHGSPSDPGPQETFVTGIAARVQTLTGQNVRGATLAMSGAIKAAVSGFKDPVVYPLFMADGWFVSTHLPKRLKGAGLARWHMATSLGMDPGLPALALARLSHEIAKHDLPVGGTHLVLAAHGSPSDPRPARATKVFADAMAKSNLFRRVQVGFVDEEPSLETAAQVDGPALVLPFFAARAGHVLMDLPKALDRAGFTGPVLDPIGTWDTIPDLIANALRDLQKAHAA